MKEAEFRNCQFCNCHTNARVRACCAKGKAEDIRLYAAKAITDANIGPDEVALIAEAEGSVMILIGSPSRKLK